MGKTTKQREAAKTTAIALLSSGLNAETVASETGLAPRTIYYMKKQLKDEPAGELAPAQQETVLAVQKKLANQALRNASLLAEAIPDKIENATLNQVAVSYGICVDKARLLSGQSTNNHSHIHTIERAISALED